MTAQRYGWIPDHPDHRDYRFAPRLNSTKLPKLVDLRPGCSPVEAQGSIGSCTAQALVGALEFLELKAGKPLVDLSRLFLYYNERVLEHSVDYDAGAMIRDGVKSLVKTGVCEERLWPYDVKKFARKPPTSCYAAAKDHQLLSYRRVGPLADMRCCLAEGYPFVFGFTVYTAFESAEVRRTGVLNVPVHGEHKLGGHAVMAVGYDDMAKRFIVRNSWGSKWGQKGYFTMPYDYVADDSLAEDFWTLRQAEI